MTFKSTIKNKIVAALKYFGQLSTKELVKELRHDNINIRSWEIENALNELTRSEVITIKTEAVIWQINKKD